MLRKPLIIAAVTLSALTVGVAQAAPLCAPRNALVEKLKADFDEVPEAIGLANSGGLFEILSSSAGTWTVLATGPNGVACLVLSGEGWQTRNRSRENKGANTTGGIKRDL